MKFIVFNGPPFDWCFSHESKLHMVVNIACNVSIDLSTTMIIRHTSSCKSGRTLPLCWPPITRPPLVPNSSYMVKRETLPLQGHGTIPCAPSERQQQVSSRSSAPARFKEMPWKLYKIWHKQLNGCQVR